MSNQILVPSLGESVVEATVSKWLKQVGEKVDSDESLVELETDKVNVEVPAPLSGTLSSIEVKEGQTVKVGALLGLINQEASSLDDNSKVKPKEQNQESYTPPKPSKKKESISKNKTKKFKEEENLVLLNENEEENITENLILDTLVEDDVQEEIKESEEKKYVPPRSRQHLSPSVRKMVEENR